MTVSKSYYHIPDFNQNRKKIHIKWKQLLIALIAILVIFIIYGFIVNSVFTTTVIANMDGQDATSNQLNGNIENNNLEYHEITVMEGQTLWEIAEKYIPEQEDPRNFIHEIREYNDLETAEIKTGEQLKIPKK